jgi:hypothetical protein
LWKSTRGKTRLKEQKVSSVFYARTYVDKKGSGTVPIDCLGSCYSEEKIIERDGFEMEVK